MSSNKVFFVVQSILRYFPFRLGIYLRYVFYKPFFKAIGKNVRIFDSVVIKYPDEIAIGDNVTINHFCYIVGKSGLDIGDDVMIGAGAKITTSSHNFSDTNIPMLQQGVSFEKITVDNDVWFGFNVVVLGGSYINRGTILAANTVVNSKTIEAFSIIGGVPGKLIGTRK